MKGIIIGGANIIEKRGKILLIQEKSKKVRGKWNFPGGALNINEDIVTCAKREGLEETGFKIKPSYLIGIYNQLFPTMETNLLLFIFKSDILGGKLTHNKNEVLDIKWFSFKEIEELNNKNLLAFPYVMKAINDYRDGKKIPLNFIKIL